MILIYIIKLVIFLFIIIFDLFYINNKYIIDDHHNFDYFHEIKFSTFVKNITNIPNILLTVIKINYYYSKVYNLIQIIYYIKITDNSALLKPSDFTLLYDLHIFCNIHISDNNESLYSIPNIYKNKFLFCVENINLNERVKFGIKIYKINEKKEENESYEFFFFSQNIININLNPIFQNNNKFNINYIYENYNAILSEINKYKNKHLNFFLKNGCYPNLKSSFLKPPLPFLKRDISQVEGRWYFNNIYEDYFCFCRGEACINLIVFNKQNFQSCKYYFYLTIIDNNRNLYEKNHYLLSDFFQENIESIDAFHIFLEMIKDNINAHYLTMSSKIYDKFNLENVRRLNEMKVIYGVRKINGNILEKYFELFLRLKAVIAAEKYDSIDNIFYNIEYINYIFLGHGVTYIKSFLYDNYLSPNNYNKILLPPSEKFISLALKAGWKNENIIKIGYPRWDNYNNSQNLMLWKELKNKEERAIFMMFTWRKIKSGKAISNLYFQNIYNILNNRKLKKELKVNNIKFFFCYHHCLKKKKIIKFNKNVRLISQDEISTLLKNSSLIITDFSSILFDAIVQKKPLILYIPDALEPDLKDIYSKEYYETITNLVKGIPYLSEIILEIEDVINKIIYYIQNDFSLESEKLSFYKEFGLKSGDNTRRFLNYIKMLD